MNVWNTHVLTVRARACAILISGQPASTQAAVDASLAPVIKVDKKVVK